MPSIAFSVVFLFLTNFFIEPTACALPAYIQNLELDDITSLVDKFPAIIAKVKEAVNRFRCPKGWRRLGGSCYYLPDIKSTAINANETCNFLHSNQSNLMQIRNAIELLYAAHVLTKNNLSSLVIDIDPKLLKGKSITEILMDDQGRWQRMKDKFRKLRARYSDLKRRILQEVESAGLRLSRRSKNVKKKVRKYKEKYKYDSNNKSDRDDDDDEVAYDDGIEQAMNNDIVFNQTDDSGEYEYDDFDSDDENQNDEFEHDVDSIKICDQIDWNVLNNDSTVYVLTTYLISEQIICSLSNVEPDIQYNHVCEYVLDFCFANIVCGKHGHCVNTLSGFKCSCSFLYGGLLCERISRQGWEILVGIILVAVLYGLSLKPCRWGLKTIIAVCIKHLKRCSEARKAKRELKKKNADDERKLVPIVTENVNNENPKNEDDDDDADADVEQEDEDADADARRPSLVEEFWELVAPQNLGHLKNPNKRDLCRNVWVSGLTIFFLLILFVATTLIHFASFKYEINDETKLESLVNDTLRLVTHCQHISNSLYGNLVFFPVAICLIAMFSWSVKRERRCLKICDGRPGLIPPIEPFRTSNRFTTATIFGILAFEVLKIFEELLFSSVKFFAGGVLVELIERMIMIILVGVRYYPVLASLQLRNVVSRFFIALYMLGDIAYTIVREGSCMGFLPLSKYYSSLEEAKLRIELGSWFIVYGLIKTSPHFFFLSYIAAELCVRFGYDALYVPIKKNLSVWTAPLVEQDELAFSKYYVAKLFRRNLRAKQKEYQRMLALNKKNGDNSQGKNKSQKSRIKRWIGYVYECHEDFRYTTIATCTYVVALIFLYYLACTCAFIYISRTTGHLSFIRYYIESTLNIEFKGFFSLKLEILMSAAGAFSIYAVQLFLGMQNYKKHKLDLFKGVFDDIPSASNFKPNSIVSKSVHYSGFLVGYMAWGFLITFHLLLLILSFLHIISAQMRYIEIGLALIVPVSVVYLLKMTSASTTGTFCFMRLDDEKINLDNRKTYAIFLYFNFFADCFLGIASCIIRFVKATCLNLLFMARLDCSFLGRPIERFDLGYAAYVSYLHMEAAHTNPVLLAFCYTLYDDVVKNRPKHCYDDECCIAPGELDDDEEELVPSQKHITNKETSSANNRNQNINGSSKISQQGSISSKQSIKEKHRLKPGSNHDDDDDDGSGGLSVREVKPKAKSPTPSTVSDKSSQKSKTGKLTINDKIKEENEEEEEEDGGIRVPTTTTIGRLIPEREPQLPVPSAPKPYIPPRQDLHAHEDDNDDDFDDDGGLKPPSISTISTIIPSKVPTLMPIQGKSPPRIPKRDDIIDEEDDDGGINSQIVAKRKLELEEKKKQREKEKSKKKSIVPDDEADDDGGIRKVKPNPKVKPKKNAIKPIIFDDEDDDGGVLKEKQKAAEKKKNEQEAKKKKKEQKKILRNQENDEDDDGGAPKQNKSTKKKKDPPKKVSKSAPLNDDNDDVDEDGGRIVKTYDTIRMAMPMTKPVLHNRPKETPSPEALDDGSMLTSRRPLQPLLASYDTVGRMVPKISTEFRKIPEDNNYDTIPTDEERIRRAHAIHSSPPKDITSSSNDLILLRTISYREAQQATPPVTLRRSNHASPSLHSGNNTNEDSSHYSEITENTLPSGIINRSYSHSGSIRSTSNHSIKQQNRYSSEKTLKEQHTEESTVSTEEDEEEEERESDMKGEITKDANEQDDEEEEEEEEDEEEDDKPLRGDKTNGSTAYAYVGAIANIQKSNERKIAIRKKQARFRWFLAYTLINNYHLFDLRKQAESRLAMLRFQRGVIIEETQDAPASPVIEPFEMTEMPQSPGARSLHIRAKRSIQKPNPSPQPRPPTTRRLLSIPVTYEHGSISSKSS